MGKRGPKRKPTSQLEAAGRDPKRRRPKNEPKPPSRSKKPKPPPWLSAGGRVEWNRLAQTLYDIGTLTIVDENLFAAYCEAAAQYRQASLDLQAMAKEDKITHGGVIKTHGGNFIQNPMVGLVNTLRRDMLKLAAEFGLSPASRASIELGGGGGGGGGGRPIDRVAERFFGKG